MRIIRIYQPGSYDVGDVVELSDTAAQHVGVVLRMQPFERLTLFCGDNREFLAQIIQLHKKKIEVRIDEVFFNNRESPRVIHLAQAISKGERMEWALQKAVELGVSSVTPVLTAHCAVKCDANWLLKKERQWQSIAIAACEQSGRNQIPTIHPVCSYMEYIQSCNATMKWMLHPESNALWREQSFIDGDMALLVGPEGGFRDDEVLAAKALGFVALRLGPRILRTETAAIAALSLLQGSVGDL